MLRNSEVADVCRCGREGGERGSEKGETNNPAFEEVRSSISQLGQLLRISGTSRENRASYCSRVRTKSAGPIAGPRLREAKEARKATT
jgi:hypothetical protein